MRENAPRWPMGGHPVGPSVGHCKNSIEQAVEIIGSGFGMGLAWMAVEMAESEVVPTPHDRLVKRIFSRPKTAAVILRRVLPSRVLAHLDLGRIEVVSTDFVGPRLGRRHSDLVYSIGIHRSSESMVVFAAIEHQSTPLRLLVLRMFWYVGWLWERHLASMGPGLETIPLVLPIVMVQCASKWNGPDQLSELFEIPNALKDDLVPPIELKLWVDDLGETVLDDPMAEPEILAVVELTRALLFAYHHPASVTDARIEALAPLFDTVLRYSRDDAEALWTYVTSAFEEHSPLRTMLLNAVNEENQAMGVTYREAWLAEGMGKAILQVLECRNLAVPDELQQRVLATRDDSTLQRWLRRAVSADSLEGVFEPVAQS